MPHYFNAGLPATVYLNVKPILDSLRGDARFQQLVQRVSFVALTGCSDPPRSYTMSARTMA